MAVDFDGEHVPSPFPATLTDGMSVEFYARRDRPNRVKGAWATDALDRSYKRRYPSRNPVAKWRAWRDNRRVDKMIEERKAKQAR